MASTNAALLVLLGMLMPQHRLLLFDLIGLCLGNESNKLVNNQSDKKNNRPVDDPQNTMTGTCTRFVDDEVEDSLYDPVQPDPDSVGDEAVRPPLSTLEEEIISTMELGSSCDSAEDEDAHECETSDGEQVVDPHWGSDPEVLRMKDALKQSGGKKRPPIFLVPGLAASRLVSWNHKKCRHKPLMSDIRVQDYVWLNLNLIMQMGTMDERCFVECIKLGINQTDSSEDPGTGCKLRPDEGLDAISSLSVGGIQSQLFMGRTNTVYSWLIQWLSDHLGYDVSSIVGFPYDWRLSPDKLEERDGLFTYMRKRIEAAVESNGEPGILVAHSMGNLVFRYFLSWLRVEFTAEAYLDSLEKSEAVRILEQTLDSASRRTRSRYRRRKNLGPLADIERKRGNTTFWDEAKRTGNKRWRDWIDSHIWTYVGLSAPQLGAVNPLRAAISGETMGLPIPEETAREMEVTFGSTLTIGPVSSQVAFCDEFDFQQWDEEPKHNENNQQLGCLDDLALEIENHCNGTSEDPWRGRGLSALRSLLVDRVDWDTSFPMIEVLLEEDCSGASLCLKKSEKIGPADVQNGRIFTYFSELWPEDNDPLYLKYQQLRAAFWDNDVPNILAEEWVRPPFRHVIFAYGTDVPTEVGYTYLKQNEIQEAMCAKSGLPNLLSVLEEIEGGQILEERLDSPRGLFSSKPKKKNYGKGNLHHSGDGSVPYLSLSFAHLWLLYGIRAQVRSDENGVPRSNPLDEIQVSHRPKGGTEWKSGIPDASTSSSSPADTKHLGDTGTSHPHGTKYKPEMHRFHTSFTLPHRSEVRTTTVIEAAGVEHKETTRNYDILAAVFTDVLKAMHNDFDF